ncbi:MAG: hypothetical protein C4522_02310 [Desulfobacteraceae bacterium]|nr:MAG: hypothetical protein C4522_02310 [Desulfobacteraceae bacterium]
MNPDRNKEVKQITALPVFLKSLFGLRGPDRAGNTGGAVFFLPLVSFHAKHNEMTSHLILDSW